MKLLRFYLQRVCIFSLKHCIRSLVCMTCMIKVFATLFGRHVYLTTHSMLCYLYSSMHEGQRKCGINTVLASTVCPFLVQCSMQEGKNIYKHLYFCVWPFLFTIDHCHPFCFQVCQGIGCPLWVKQADVL